MSATLPQAEAQRGRSRRLLIAALAVACGLLAIFLVRRHLPFSILGTEPASPPPLPVLDLGEPARQLAVGRHLTVWWDNLPPELRARARPTGTESNIAPADYVGPEACKGCHAANYQFWAKHPHRWMNALASEATVLGDFSGGAAISYRGGRATFSRTDAGYFMRLERGGRRRLYAVTQTIGSRFFQYYVGKLLEGPEPPGHHFYAKEHVLPFGYWLDEKEWVPVVHIGPESRDEDRPDPFDPPAAGRHYAEYAASCNYCHTTFPLGDLLSRRPRQMGEHAPVTLHWSVRKYLESAHPAEMQSVIAAPPEESERNPMAAWEAPRYAATLGVSCEACHLGSKRHVESGGRVRPDFFPRSPQLFAALPAGEQPDSGRTHDNVNWACGRCHTGGRPAFAAGMSTWNSVEYADAMRGSCYSRARCVDCHNPHRPIGKRWSQTADQDDASCLKCHQKFEPAAARAGHTHHPPGSEGARCMNCHMPRINEGLQDVVRTHMIFSPTRRDMIEANQPNACNVCHVDRPIDWTLGRLKEWYGKIYDPDKIAANYPVSQRPVALGWLDSDNMAVRLVGADALTRAGSRPALPRLLDALDDPYLLNRQFAARGLEEMLHVRLSDFNYRFYMTAEERRNPLTDLRARFAPAGHPKAP
jgi:hypothetical protein